MPYCEVADVRRVSGIVSTSATELTNDMITSFIEEADALIENWTGKIWREETITEYFPGRAEKITSTDSVSRGQYYEETEEDKYVIILSNYPVVSITSLQYLDDDGTVNDTLTEDDDFHVWLDTGKIRIFTSSIPVGVDKKKVKVVYVHGITTSVPKTVRELSATIAAIQCFTNLTGGSFDDITTYTLGPLSVGVGEPYMNMRAAIRELERKRDYLLNAIGRKIRTVVI